MSNVLYVVGSINVDLTIDTQRMPKQGETIKGSHFQQLPGGKGANQAIAACALGVKTFMVGNVGNDSNGEFSKQNFENYGVCLDYLDTDDAQTTGIAMIIKSEGDNRIILNLGANEQLRESTITRALQHIQKGDVVLTQLENPIHVVEHALALAKEKGAITVFNPAPAEHLPDSMYAYIDTIVVNETETELLTGISPVNEITYKQAAQVFLDKGVKSVIITLGAKGSVWLDQESSYFAPAYTVDVIDTTGAGDSFIGGFIASQMKHETIAYSLQFANAVSAVMCQIDGAQSQKLTYDTVMTMMKG